MSAFKKLDRKDVFTTVHLATKSNSTSGSNASDYGISFLSGVSGSLSFPGFSSPASLQYPAFSYEQLLQYRSIRQLYYGNVSEDLLTGSFEEYRQSSIYSGSRYLGDRVGVVSFPRSRYGEALKPGTFSTDISTEYVQNEGDYVLETIAAGGEYIEDLPSGSVIDDGEGSIISVGSYSGVADGTRVGDIFYNHGMVVFTDNYFARYFSNEPIDPLSWSSLLSVYTFNYKLKIRDEEFNFSLNPSAIKNDGGSIADNISGSYFKPYITTVGLYNDDQELIAVAKLSQPIPKSTDTDMTFVLKLDI